MTPSKTGGDRPSEHIEGVSYVPHFPLDRPPR
jgi:hypothetical protein